MIIEYQVLFPLRPCILYRTLPIFLERKKQQTFCSLPNKIKTPKQTLQKGSINQGRRKEIQTMKTAHTHSLGFVNELLPSLPKETIRTRHMNPPPPSSHLLTNLSYPTLKRKQTNPVCWWRQCSALCLCKSHWRGIERLKGCVAVLLIKPEVERIYESIPFFPPMLICAKHTLRSMAI
jgi:hypothetical protein